MAAPTLNELIKTRDELVRARDELTASTREVPQELKHASSATANRELMAT